jgi:hypothetical protein
MISMNVSVIDPPFNDIHFIYKVDIETPFSSWSVIKRFNQFIDIDKEFRTEFSEEMKKIIDLPKKKMFNSLDSDITKQRANTLTLYLSEISQNEILNKSQIIARFLRSDVYLESYIDLVEGDELREVKLRADNLIEKANLLLKTCNENQNEIMNTHDQYSQCEENIINLKKNLDSSVRTLERLSFLRSNNREIKAEVKSNLNTIIENYKNINQILTINKDKVWKRIINISLLNEDLIFLSTKINRLGETLDNISSRATSSDINDIKNQINILKKKSDTLLSEISSIRQNQQ